MARRTGERLAVAALAALVAAVPARAAEEVRVTASADRTELREDEALTLTIRVESDEAPSSVDLPGADLPFTIVSRSQSRQASFTLDGGGMSMRRTTVLTLSLAPRRAGDLVIPPAVAVVEGVRHEAAPIRVKVTEGRPGATPPARRGGAWSGWERDLVLQVEVDRREVFLGEQVTATVWLLSPAGVVAYEAYRPPAYDGFWVEEIEAPRRLRFQLRDVNGVPTRAYVLQRLALFPTRAGTLELGPFQVDVAVRVGSEGLFAAFPEVRRARRRSAPVALRVRPLPAGAPAGFEGVNVGTLALEATASESRVAAGEPVTVRVTASGEGNVRALALPRLPDLPGARRFEPTLSDEVTVRGGRLGGARTLETVLVPERAGEVVVPALAWPHFDPRTGRYEVARTRALRIEVLPGAGGEPSAAEDPALAALRPLRTDGTLAPRGPPPWARAPFLLLLAVPPLAFAAAAISLAARRRAAEALPARRAERAGRRAAERLAAARGRLAAGERGGGVDEVERALAGYCADRLGRPVASLRRDELGAALAGAGARPGAISALVAALDACDASRFGGGAEAEEEVVARAERALALLEGGEEGS